MLENIRPVLVSQENQMNKFVLLVAERSDGRKRFFLRAHDRETHDHTKIRNEFLEEVGPVPAITLRSLGGGFLAVHRKSHRPQISRDVVILNGSSEMLGSVKNQEAREALWKLLQEEYPDCLIDMTHLD